MRHCVFILLLFCSFFSINSQTQDLLNLASGELMHFNIIYNNYDPEDTCYICTEKDDVFGYYTIYNNGEVNKKIDEIEYVLLDKNLNKFANGTFKKLKAPWKSKSILRIYKKVDTIVIRNSIYSIAALSAYRGITIFQKLLIKENTLLPAYYHDNNGNERLVNLDSLAESFTKRRLKQLDDEVEWAKAKKDSTTLNKTLFSYDNERTKLILKKDGDIKRKYIDNLHDVALIYRKGDNEIWQAALRKADKKQNIYHTPIFLDKENKNIGIIRYTIDKKLDDSDVLIFDLNTGDLKSTYAYNKDSDYNYRDYLNLRDNRLTILSSLGKGDFLRGFNFHKYDVGQNKEIGSKMFIWEDAAQFIDVNKKGIVENGMQLRFLNYFFLKNGNIGILTEKYRVKSNGKVVTTDYVFFMFDEEFNLIDATTITKDKSKSYSSSIDYLFSQQVEGGSIVFYRDYKKDDETKKKHWILGIITYIDGEFGHQTLPMTSEEFSIQPFPAKEGYVLLTEFNENEEKYNKIRLEKINY